MNTRYEVLKFKENSDEVISVKDKETGIVFSIGDHIFIKNVEVNGKIRRFEYSLKTDEFFVYTTWSGIGFQLSRFTKKSILPSRFQIEDLVSVKFDSKQVLENCKVIKVHFNTGKVQYDLEVKIESGFTRIYNIDSIFLFEK